MKISSNKKAPFKLNTSRVERKPSLKRGITNISILPHFSNYYENENYACGVLLLRIRIAHLLVGL